MTEPGEHRKGQADCVTARFLSNLIILVIIGATALVALGVLNPLAMKPTVATRMQVGVYPVPKKLAVYTATSQAYIGAQNGTTFATGFSVFF